MSGGKTSKQESKVEIPKALEEAGEKNLSIAEQISKLPYSPNMGVQVAAFTPQQEAAFGNIDNASAAFGLGTSGGNTGLPKAQNVDGFRGYSTESLYNDALNSSMSPEVQAAYKNALNLPEKAAAPKGGGKQSAGELAGAAMMGEQPQQQSSQGAGKTIG